MANLAPPNPGDWNDLAVGQSKLQHSDTSMVIHITRELISVLHMQSLKSKVTE